MSNPKQHKYVKPPSNKSFGIVFGVVFLAIGLYPLASASVPRYFPLSVALVIFAIAFLAPKLLSVPNRLWFRFGVRLSTITTPLVLTLIYIISVLPVGLFLRLIGKDLLGQRLEKNANSYWIESDQRVGSMRDQF